MKRIVLLLCLAVQSWAYSSLVVASGVSGVLTVPAIAPFTTMGDYRVEFRIHDWMLPSKTSATYISWGSVFTGARYLEIIFTSAGEICAADWVDTLSSNGNKACAVVTGHTDIVVRVQRFAGLPSRGGSPGSFGLEVQDIDGTPITSYCGVSTRNTACAIDAVGTKDWSATAGYVGNPSYSTAFSLGWLKWFSTTVSPGSIFSQESTVADLADWRFENSLIDGSTAAKAPGIGSFTSTPSYAVSQSHAPACIAGAQQVLRAGYPAQLDGTGSYPLNGGSTLSFFWQERSGPTRVRWSAQNTATPSVSQSAFGSYVFQLTVTDSSGQASVCTVKDGFVATDNNGVVITGNSTVDTLLGPMIRYSTNPWPWFDDRHKADADLQASALDTYFAPFWQTPLAGTVTFTSDSPTVTGVGTTFTTTFCGGTSAPSTPLTYGGGNIAILLLYPDASLEGYGVRAVQVKSCESDTALTLATNWYPDVADCHNGGCTYSANSQEPLSGVWTYNAAPANFYDAVAGFYSMYYRTGLDDYQTAARKLADRFWKYFLDSGTSCRLTWPYPPDNCPYPHSISLLGMTLRATDGRADMWPGLERMFTYYINELRRDAINGYVADVREQGYHLAMLSYCALYDPTLANRTACKTAISTSFNNLWNISQDPDGSWPQFYSTYQSTATATATVTNGSTTVVGNGTTWTSAVNTGHILFYTSTSVYTQPHSRAGQESTYYTVTYVDATHLTLDRPYEGTSATRGWVIKVGGGTGWGVQPFIEGLLGIAFEFAGKAIADTDPTNSALAFQHVVDIANWQKNVGYRSAANGMYYWAGQVDCLPPIPETATWCTASYGYSGARVLSAESLRSVALGYSHSKDSSLKDFGDLLYNGMFGKPGTCPSGSTVCLPDGTYVDALNTGTGYYMTGTPPNNGWHKYFGMFFGIGAGADWPAYRVGGSQPISTRPVHLAYDQSLVPGATQVRVTTTKPTGEVQETYCASSPCSVPIDGGVGEHIFQVEYLSASGTVLTVTEIPNSQGR